MDGVSCYHFLVADSAWVPSLAAAASGTKTVPRHRAVVRVTHWIATLCFFALLLSGLEIVISHPRFYWGETGNVRTPALFSLPIPASRASVPTGYGFVLPDQNGWSRSMHFQAAWGLVLTGLWYVIAGLLTGHFRKNLVPAAPDLRWDSISGVIQNHLRFRPPAGPEAGYNVLQRLTYLGVIFVVVPLMIWTGLAMSPSVTSAFPALVTFFGGQQSARTLHFFGTLILVLFLLVHIMMICLAGFRSRMRAMVSGHASTQKGRP